MVFFILSGYLVGGSVIKQIQRNTWSWRNYLTKRLTRLWMVLIPALLFGVSLDYAGLHLFSSTSSLYVGPPQGSIVLPGLLARLSAPVVAGNAVFLQSIAVNTAGTNNALWSLANEFWYYLAFPLLLLAFLRNRRLLHRGLYLLVVVGIGLFVGKQICQLFFIWMLGALLAVAPPVIHRAAAKLITAILILQLPFIFVVVRRASLQRYTGEWIVAGYFTITLYLILHLTAPARPGIYQGIASFASRISYTLYLVHLPLAVFLRSWIGPPWNGWPMSPRNIEMFILFNLGLVAASYLFYLAFEANTDFIRAWLLNIEARKTSCSETPAPGANS